MGAGSRPEDGQAEPSGRPEGDGVRWTPPEENGRPGKWHEGAAADRPAVTSMPGGDPAGAPQGSPRPSPHGPQVGPPPPAPEGPQPASAYPSGQTGYGAGAPPGPGYGYGGYGYGGGFGQPGPAWAQPPLPQGTAVASMVLGIIGLVLTGTCWGAFLGIFVSPVALALGVSGRRRADRGEGGGRNYATSGFVMGIIGTVLAAVVVVLLTLLLVYAEEFDSGPGSGPDHYDALRESTAVALTGR